MALGKALSDIAMAAPRALGAAHEGLKEALAPQAMQSYRDKQQLQRDLQVVTELARTNPDWMQSPAAQRLSAHVTNKYLPGVAGGALQPGEFQSPQTQTKATDPVQRAKAVAELMGQQPFSGDEEDVYDPQNPVHRVWMQSLQELEGGGAPAGTATPQEPTAAPLEAQRLSQEALSVARGRAKVPAGQGMAIASIPDEPPQPETMAGAMTRGLQRPPATARSGPLPNVGGGVARGAGMALAGIPDPRQVDAALTQVEGAGGVTVRNAGKVAASKAAPADTLRTAAKAVKSYKASPEYAEVMRQTGRLLNETDLSAPMKEVLAGQGSAEQKRLLKLIHQHGQEKVLAAVQKNQSPRGEY
jgi:hypothetical protein